MINPTDVMGFGTICIGMALSGWYKLRRRELELRAMNAQMANQQAPAELAALRQEIASLRDTTTQFDMSVERTLTELQHRVASLEAVRSSTVTTSNQAETQGVEVGRRRSQ